MLTVNIIFEDKEIQWNFPDPTPNVGDLREFIKAQYPESLGAEYIDK